MVVISMVAGAALFGAGAAFMNLASGSVWKLSAMNAHSIERSSPLTRRWRKTDSNSRSLREGKGYGQPLQASIAVSDLNL
jgi:hypothetical protein